MIFTKNKEIKIKLPDEVKLIIHILQNNCFEAYAVGGCIRDSLIGKSPMDWDITTSANPEQVKTIFKALDYKVIDTGIKHGTVTILINTNSYEVTTYRIEGEYLDSRHPSKVFFTDTLREDLLRRDFTINAMAYNDEQGLKDYFNGLKDLKDKRIKTVGNAEDRFKEDALRLLRAIRFSTVLNYKIDKQVEEGIKSNSKSLSKVSVERIRDEFVKIFVSDRPAYGVKKLYDLKLLDFIIPELNQLMSYIENENQHSYNYFFKNNLEILDETDCSLTLRLSILVYNIIFSHKEQNIDVERNIKKILKPLKFDNITINKISVLVNHCTLNFNISSVEEIKKFIVSLGEENLHEFFNLIFAILKCNPKDCISNEDIINLKNKCYEILENNDPLYIKDLEIDGNNLISLGVPKGKFVGDILQYLLLEVLKDKSKNKKDILVELAKKYCNLKGYHL